MKKPRKCIRLTDDILPIRFIEFDRPKKPLNKIMDANAIKSLFISDAKSNVVLWRIFAEFAYQFDMEYCRDGYSPH